MYGVCPICEIRCLDHGFVRLVDYMGSDEAVVEAARVSYQKGTTQKREGAALIRYLMRHRHMTPFEMCEFKFHAKMPIFVARQWVRHRTASINEVSARYSEMEDCFHIPELRLQGSGNKQVADGPLAEGEEPNIKEHCSKSYLLYQELLSRGVGREIARCVLPVSFYTEWYWKVDLRNLFGFILLRSDPHAQKEIRCYSDAMLELIRPIVPTCVDAFEEYMSQACTFSRTELAVLRGILSSYTNSELRALNPNTGGEANEFIAKCR